MVGILNIIKLTGQQISNQLNLNKMVALLIGNQRHRLLDLLYERVKPYADLANFVDIMPFVDALDSGGITLQEFVEDGELMCFSELCHRQSPNICLILSIMLAAGSTIDEIMICLRLLRD